MRKTSTLLLIGGVISSLFAAPATAGVTPERGTLSIHRDVDDILWAEVSITAPGVVKLTIHAPGGSGDAGWWQRCRFGGSDEGIYRCGIDIAAGSIARKEVGKWSARATVDGVTVGRLSFNLVIKP